MGKKAKIKQQRKDQLNQTDQNSELKNKYNSTQFVDQIQRQGYSLKYNQFHAPEMPDDEIKPQV